jgi:hypothetical protein
MVAMAAVTLFIFDRTMHYAFSKALPVIGMAVEAGLACPLGITGNASRQDKNKSQKQQQTKIDSPVKTHG